MWRCRCDCGKSHDILGERLTHPSKPTLSCGCLRVEAMMTNLHRMRAARNAQLARMREARLANLATAVKASTRKRDECRVREEREERERQAASLELARCLGYITGGDR